MYHISSCSNQLKWLGLHPWREISVCISPQEIKVRNWISYQYRWPSLPYMRVVPCLCQVLHPQWEIWVHIFVESRMWLNCDTWQIFIAQVGGFQGVVGETFPNLCILYLPHYCTSKLQPTDVAIQTLLQAILEEAFMEYAYRQIFNKF